MVRGGFPRLGGVSLRIPSRPPLYHVRMAGIGAVWALDWTRPLPAYQQIFLLPMIPILLVGFQFCYHTVL